MSRPILSHVGDRIREAIRTEVSYSGSTLSGIFHAMATTLREGPLRRWIVRFLPLQTLKDAQELVRRFREVDGIRLYVQERQGPVLAAALVIVFISIACAVGVVVFLADRHSLLALLGILLLPVALAGSFFVMAFVFLSWIEGRALARELGHYHRPQHAVPAASFSGKVGLYMGPVPPVPWLLAVMFLFVPLALLAVAWLSAALTVILLGILMPVVYAKFDA